MNINSRREEHRFKSLKRSSVIVSVLLIIAITTFIVPDNNLILTSSGATLYVPTNYPTIQDAINASKDGDTVFVYNGTYYESVVVNKTINLIGEDKNNTIIDNRGNNDTVRVTADWVNITGLKVNRSDWDKAGIELSEVQNCHIANNIITNNGNGIYLNSSSDNKITDNNVSWNYQYNIYLHSSNGNNINGNTADSSSDISIFLDTSSNNTISNNNISNNTGPTSGTGISLSLSPNNNISNNNISNNTGPTSGTGISLSLSPNNNISNNNIMMNWLGISLHYSSFINIINNNVSNIYNGIILDSSSNNNIVSNNISSHEHDGIRISMNIGEEESSNNVIVDNNITENRNGIELVKSPYNFIANNNISNNRIGICLDHSSSIRIMNNNFVKDGVFIQGNEVSHYNSHIIPTDNLVNGEPLYYYKDTDGLFVDRIPVGQLILANCTYWDIRNLQINNTDVGIELGFSSNITVTNNNVSSNDICSIYLDNSPHNNITCNFLSINRWMGIWSEWSFYNNIKNNNISSNLERNIYFWDSSNNDIINNSISSSLEYGILFRGGSSNNRVLYNSVSNNQYGLYLYGESNSNIITNNSIFNNTRGIVISSTLTPTIDNKVYHNYIIDNIVQAYDDTIFGNQWDNGYPSGGNYWSDFDEPSEGAYDDYTGPNQDISGNDGIVDKGKGAGGGLNPYIIDADSIDLYPLWERNEYSMILKQGWNLISIPLIQVEQDLTKVLGSIAGLYDAVQWYDITDKNDPWKHYRPGKPYGNDLFEINETMGFWIHIIPPGDTIFRYNGVRPTQNQSITLYPGWNLVGYPSLSNKNRTPALNNINFGNDVDSIWTYNAATQKWKEIGEFDYFELGKGYWIHSKVNKVWDVPL